MASSYVSGSGNKFLNYRRSLHLCLLISRVSAAYVSINVFFVTGTILLDLEESDFPHIISAIVEEMIDVGQIKEKNRQDVLRALLLKHRFVS